MYLTKGKGLIQVEKSSDIYEKLIQNCQFCETKDLKIGDRQTQIFMVNEDVTFLDQKFDGEWHHFSPFKQTFFSSDEQKKLEDLVNKWTTK